MAKTFLQAEWRKLAIANYSVERKLLNKYLPRGTELDLWNGICYVSLVGFMFLNTKVKGVKIPFHINFEEVNLRFYVRHKHGSEWRRGVVFIKEIVSRPALSFVANAVYKENYETMPMSHSWIALDDGLSVEYKWKKGRWNSLKVITGNESELVKENSEEEFITEHYWGYTKVSEEKTSEYGVEHPGWEVYKTKDYYIDVDFGNIYGKEFKFLSSQKPVSVFLAEGSEIKVKSGGVI
ncbi:MAG TPA: DUF2071 domain-containing protein [Ignavibacteria bacterium]|nr:hypothetical protein [Bacteroidota bacterium]HRI84500.1 DUF2071 domain-containing protein [Ignavibacteria bacterium]HRK00568.1 DUF2071 domain-containing protein [Ignavibacteria bacterium]